MSVGKSGNHGVSVKMMTLCGTFSDFFFNAEDSSEKTGEDDSAVVIDSDGENDKGKGSFTLSIYDICQVPCLQDRSFLCESEIW